MLKLSSVTSRGGDFIQKHLNVHIFVALKNLDSRELRRTIASTETNYISMLLYSFV